MSRVPFVVAHRGVSAFYPENTRASFQAAIDLKVDWIELDVVTTADNIIIVSHDTTADRCTNGSGLFHEMTWEQVQKLDAGIGFDARFSGERIPTLEDVITMLEETSIRLCVEIKGRTPDENLTTARTTVALLQARNFIHRTSISSFEPGCLRAIREWEPRIAVNLDPTPQDGSLSPDELCEQCLSSGANFMSHTYEHLTPAHIDAARAHGLALWAWTVNDAEAMRRMIALDVEAILSDDPAKVQETINATMPQSMI